MVTQEPIFHIEDIETVVDNQWQVVGENPAILLDPTTQPIGWTKILFVYQSEPSIMLNPVLSFYKNGERTRIRLDRDKQGLVSHVVKLPPEAIDLRIELLGVRGRFTMGRAEFQNLTRKKSFLAVLLQAIRSWRALAKTPKGVPGGGVAGRTLRYVKRNGIRALVIRLKQAFGQGVGAELLAGRRLADYEALCHGWSLHKEDFERIKSKITEIDEPPIISVVMPVYNPPEKWLRQAIESVLDQAYPYWELCIANDASTQSHVAEVLNEYAHADNRIKVVRREKNGHISAASNSALELAAGKWVALLDHDDVLHPAALFCLADQINKQPNVQFIYTDEDKIDENGVHFQPHFKPDLNKTLLRSQNYVNHFVAVERLRLEKSGRFRSEFDGAQDYDLFLRCTEKLSPEQIAHIPLPLYSWRTTKGSTSADAGAKTYAEKAGRQAVETHLLRLGIKAEVTIGAAPTTYRVKYELPSERPMVSVVIPTRDGVSHLRKCLASLEEHTTYPNYEVVIVDNGSAERETLDFLKSQAQNPQISILRFPGEFNYSAINNAGVNAAKGSIVCLLNDDTEATTSGWLSEMVGQLWQPEVGVVGAKLLYPDQTIQHAGVVTGIGGFAGHGHKHATRSDHGYFARLTVTHEVGAVTGACLLTTRKLWDQIGGLDAENFKIAFNDVDYCLRARQAGYKVIWTPYAELLHHESKSRGLDLSPEKKERLNKEGQALQARWGEQLLLDPAYSPNLSLDTERFELADKPRFSPPWAPARSS